MTIEITKPEIEDLINERLRSGAFADVEDVILQALQASPPDTSLPDERRRDAIERLRTFGKGRGLSLGGTTIRELRDQARP